MLDISTINQIIETSGYIVISFIALFAYSQGKKFKTEIETEIVLLKDCLFYKNLILKYIKEKKLMGIPQNYRKYRKEVTDEMDYYSSNLTTPSSIRKRLEELSLTHKEIESFLNRMKL